MSRTALPIIVVFGICWVSSASWAAAQPANPFDPAARARQYSQLDARPTVSPYVNLSYNNDGVSNYQTLIRPLIEERAELNRQWTALERLNQELRGSPPGARKEPVIRGVDGRPAKVRFMHYSHYFGNGR